MVGDCGLLIRLVAEFRGPGVRRQYDDSGDDFDLDMDRSRGLGGRAGRIILLGDGTEVLTDSDEHEIVEHDEEEEDLESGGAGSSAQQSDEQRSAREGTPGPESAKSSTEQSNSPSTPAPGPETGSSSSSKTPIKQAADDPKSL